MQYVSGLAKGLVAMGYVTAEIHRVRIVRDLQDRIEWDVGLALPKYAPTGPRTISYFDWSGEIGLYRNVPHPNTSPTSSDPDRRSLITHLVPDYISQPKGAQGTAANITLSTPIETTSVERLERFRCDGSLYARAEGTLLMLCGQTLEEQLRDSGAMIRHSVITAPYELTTSRWCEEYLPRLLPPGKFVFEFDVADDIFVPNLYRAQIQKARRAYYDMRFDDMARELYVLIDKIPEPSAESTETSKALRNVVKALKQLINLHRHGNPEGRSPLQLTRPLARFLLVSVMQQDVLRGLGEDDEQAK